MESEIEKVVSSEIIPEAERIYQEGMSQEEFMNELLSGMEVKPLRDGSTQVRDAPKWLHDLLDIIWDGFSTRR